MNDLTRERLATLYLNHGTARVRLKQWTLRNVVVFVVEVVVRDRSRREEFERLGVLLAQAFGDREAVHVGTRSALRRRHVAAEHLLRGRRVARETSGALSEYLTQGMWY